MYGKQFPIKSELPNFILMKKRAEEKSGNLTILGHHLGRLKIWLTATLPDRKMKHGGFQQL